MIKPCILILLGLTAVSCKTKVGKDNSGTQTFVQNGVTWGFGSIDVERVDVPGLVMVERLNPEVPLSDAGARFNLFRALDAADQSDKASLMYADYAAEDQENKVLIAYVFDLRFQLRTGSTNVIDVWAYLKRSGRSAERKKEVWLGAATFENGENLARLNAAKDLQISKIVRGVRSGYWVMHYAKVATLAPADLKKLCGVRTDQSGRLPNQLPGDAGCRPIPTPEEECAGSPVSEECRAPLPSLVIDMPAKAVFEVEGLDKLEERVYKIKTMGEPGYIKFVAEDISSSDDDNSKQCDDRFFAVARTIGDRVNPACRIIRAASPTAAGGKLACRVQVQFEDPLTHPEKICNVVASFKSGNGKPQLAQVLFP